MRKAFEQRSAQGAVQSTVRLGGEVKGSFAGFDGTDLWLGVYDKDQSKSKAYRGAGVLTEARALTVVAVPAEAQGAAFDREGSLGVLYKLNPKTGDKAASYEMVIGIEDIGFDSEGRLVRLRGRFSAVAAVVQDIPPHLSDGRLAAEVVDG
jgi:hypothetical protein